MKKALALTALLSGCSDQEIHSLNEKVTAELSSVELAELCDLSVTCEGDIQDACQQFQGSVALAVAHLNEYTGEAELVLTYEKGDHWGMRADGVDFYYDNSIQSSVRTTEGYGCSAGRFFSERSGGNDLVCARVEHSSPEIETTLEYCEEDAETTQGDSAFLLQVDGTVTDSDGMSLAHALYGSDDLIIAVQDFFAEKDLDWQSSGSVEATVSND